jgi:putative DNA methylase
MLDKVHLAPKTPLQIASVFIETQFPVSKLSKESYKERKAVAGQTLTGLGKWWGRKPLVMVRAVILGLLLTATNDPKRDREIFLKLMTMDEDGLWRRKRKSIPAAELYARLAISERQKYFVSESGKVKFKKGVTAEEKEALQHQVFNALSYDEKLNYCDRPEQIDGPSPEAWKEINAHLGTHASSLQELVKELGKRRFGHVPRVGDAFCGGGSVPFEAARIGCEAYGSDLNPVAALLTWGVPSTSWEADQKSRNTSRMPSTRSMTLLTTRSRNGVSSTTSRAGAPMPTFIARKRSV